MIILFAKEDVAEALETIAEAIREPKLIVNGEQWVGETNGADLNITVDNNILTASLYNVRYGYTQTAEWLPLVKFRLINGMLGPVLEE